MGNDKSGTMVGHGTWRTGVKERAALRNIHRRIEIGGSDGSTEFRCPASVHALTCGEVVSWTRTKDAWHFFYGIAALMLNTACPVGAVRDNTASFLRAGATTQGYCRSVDLTLIGRPPLYPKHKMISPLPFSLWFWTLVMWW